MKTKYQTKKRNFYYTTFGINYSEEKTEDFRRIIQTEHSCTAALSLNTHTEWKRKKNKNVKCIYSKFQRGRQWIDG